MKSALLLGAIMLGGVAAGVIVERVGLVSPLAETATAATLDEVPVFICPDSIAAGVLHRGDRVWATGRSDDTTWIEVRAPFNTAARVWVEARWLDPDSDLGELPAADCEPPELEAAPATTTSTTTVPDESSTSTSSSTTTTSPTTTTTSSTTQAPAPTTTTTTLPADQQGPIVNFFQSTESEIWEDDIPCVANPRTAQISAVVADESGLSSVTLSWSVGSANGTVAMGLLAEPVYSVTIGSFGPDTIPGGSVPISLTLTARDTYSNQTQVSSSSLISLRNCTIL